MNDCAQNRERLALLASGVIAGVECAELQAHLATCVACRKQFEAWSEIARLHSNVVDTLPSVELPQDWHQRLAARIRVLEPASAERSLSTLRLALQAWRWRLAVPAAVAIAITLLFLIRPPTDPGPITDAGGPASQPNISVPSNDSGSKFAPTILAYQRALRRSPEAFEALISRGAAGVSPSSPRVTAFSRPPDLLDE